MNPYTRMHYKQVAKAMYQYAATPSYYYQPGYDRMAMGAYPNAGGFYSGGFSNRIRQFVSEFL